MLPTQTGLGRDCSLLAGRNHGSGYFRCDYQPAALAAALWISEYKIQAGVDVGDREQGQRDHR